MYKILAVSHRKLCADFLAQTEKLAQGGIPLILREKDLPEEEYIQLAAQVWEIYQRYGAICILHFYPKAARQLGAKALHLPLWKLEENPALAQEFTIGVSSHSVEQAQKAEALGAQYIAIGHIFETNCKKDLPPRGLSLLSEVCQAVQIPVYAIGGISPANANSALEAGADGVCMMSALMQAADPAAFLAQCGV